MKELIPIVLLAAASAGAQTTGSSVANIELDAPDAPHKNRVGVSYRFGWNVRAEFENLGGFAGVKPAATDVGPATGGGVDRNYDDGYVRVDNTGNNHGPGYEDTTWYWGYDSANQVSADGWHLNFSSTSSSASSAATAASRGNKDDASHGFEIFYDRELCRNEKWRWGVEGAVGYGSVSIHDGRGLAADASVTVNVLNDAYQVTADPDNSSVPITLPAAPYAGTYNGFGVGSALIGDQPTRTISTTTTTLPNGASITGSRRLEADLWGFRLGPYVEVPLNGKWTLLFSGGLAFVNVDSEFQFSETVSVPNFDVASRSGNGSASDWLVGGYAAGSVAYSLNEHWSVLAGFQYQNVGETAQTIAGKRAVLDLGEQFYVTLGVSYGF